MSTDIMTIDNHTTAKETDELVTNKSFHALPVVG